LSFRLLAIVFVLIAGSAAAAQPLQFGPDTVGTPFSMAAAELYEPNQAGPRPGVVVLHGCDGVGRHERLWAQQLAAWGYVALVVDSFRPRGVATVCNEGMLIPPRLQAQDAFAAAAYLRARRRLLAGGLA
jgi:dienelactone hydrolase